MVDNKYKNYRSSDPLDLGEALWICHFYPHENWADYVAQRSFQGLERLWQRGYFQMPEDYRLGFREFGTTIGNNYLIASNFCWIFV